MVRDFTFVKYKELLNSIIEYEYNIIGISQYITNVSVYNDSKICMIRHDVDKKPMNSVENALLEKELGIKTTYYFRNINGSFDIKEIKEIASMGHEIGYHYETMDKTKGDKEKAIELFQTELILLRKLVDVKTICMHGSPIYPWLNSDIWRNEDIRNYQITCEAILSFKGYSLQYISDTGRSWNPKKKVKDLIDHTLKVPNIKNTTELINYFSQGFSNFVYITTHPQRWDDRRIPWLSELTSQSIKNVGKSILPRRST